MGGGRSGPNGVNPKREIWYAIDLEHGVLIDSCEGQDQAERLAKKRMERTGRTCVACQGVTWFQRDR